MQRRQQQQDQWSRGDARNSYRSESDYGSSSYSGDRDFYDQGHIETGARSEFNDTYNYNADESPNWVSNNRGASQGDRGAYEQSGQRGSMSYSGQTGSTRQSGGQPQYQQSGRGSYGNRDFDRQGQSNYGQTAGYDQSTSYGQRSGRQYSATDRGDYNRAYRNEPYGRSYEYSHSPGEYGGSDFNRSASGRDDNTDRYATSYGTSDSFGQRLTGSDYGDRYFSNSYGQAAQGSWSQNPRMGGNALNASYGQSQYGQQQSHSGKGPKGYRRSDERIKEEISDLLEQDHRVDASEIEVKVESGVVTLSGTVSDRRMKRLAEECIENSPGVQDVHNEIRVSKEASDGKSWSSSSSTDKSDRSEKDGSMTDKSKLGRTGSTTDKSTSANKIM